MPIDLTGICCLFELRYLEIVNCDKIELPSKISGVQQLETLEIDAYRVEIPLHVCSFASCCILHLITDGGISFLEGIGNMKSLHLLRFFLLCRAQQKASQILEA